MATKAISSVAFNDLAMPLSLSLLFSGHPFIRPLVASSGSSGGAAAAVFSATPTEEHEDATNVTYKPFGVPFHREKKGGGRSRVRCRHDRHFGARRCESVTQWIGRARRAGPVLSRGLPRDAS